MKKIFILFIIISVIAKNLTLQAQSRNLLDSLFTVIKTAPQTIAKVNTLNALAYELRNNSPDTAIYLSKEAQALATKLNYKQGVADAYLWRGWAIMSLGNYEEALKTTSYALYLYNGILSSENGKNTFKILNQKAKAYNNIGLIYSNKGNNSEALKNYFASLKIKKEINDQQGIAQTHNNIGSICEVQGNYPEALKNYFIALKLGEKFGNKQDVSYYYNNIGIIYFDIGNYAEALKNHLAALKIRKAFRDKKGISASYNNIGIVYFKQKNSSEALKYYASSLKIKEEIGDKQGLAQSYNNIGNFYMESKNYTAALKNYLASVKINLETVDKEGLALTYNNIGNLYLKLNKSDNEYFSKALILSKEIGNIDEIKESYIGLAELDSVRGNYKESLKHFKLSIYYRDSIVNEESTKKLVQSQMQYDFDKKESLAKAEQEKKDALTKKEIEKQKLVRNSFVGGFILVMLIAFGIYRSLQQNRKAKAIITKQKELVEEKNKEILASIEYAKRLQNAILPANKLVKEYLVDSFIYYRPKDIVAGDFYWFYPTPLSRGEGQGERIILFAAADCTGHGVPGAMVSVVCANALNKAVKELNLREPGKILDAVSEFVIETFVQKNSTHEDDVQDGMDISLCALNLNTLKLQWSGANNPLIIIRNDSPSPSERAGVRSEELKPNKQPIGLYANRKPFTTHTIQLQKGEMLYLFSDGYADQFGGTEGKKFLKKNLKNKLLSIASLPVDEQLTDIENHFNKWKGSNPQVDDVCVIGVRV